jgi:hypothetical protein
MQNQQKTAWFIVATACAAMVCSVILILKGQAAHVNTIVYLALAAWGILTGREAQPIPAHGMVMLTADPRVADRVASSISGEIPRNVIDEAVRRAGG